MLKTSGDYAGIKRVNERKPRRCQGGGAALDGTTAAPIAKNRFPLLRILL